MTSSEKNQRNPAAPKVTFGRRTGSGRYVRYSREDLESELGNVDFSKYVVQFPLTPDNQPMDVVPLDPSVSGKAAEGCDGEVPAEKSKATIERRMRSMNWGAAAGEVDYNQLLFETKGTYGYGNAIRAEEDEEGGGEDSKDFVGKPWRPLTRKLKIPAAVLSPYRCCCSVLFLSVYRYFFYRDILIIF